MSENDKCLCSGCGRELNIPEEEVVQIVGIVTLAHPRSGTRIDSDATIEELRLRIDELIRQMSGLSGAELTEGVHGSQIGYLCSDCFGRWKEDPFGLLSG